MSRWETKLSCSLMKKSLRSSFEQKYFRTFSNWIIFLNPIVSFFENHKKGRKRPIETDFDSSFIFNGKAKWSRYFYSRNLRSEHSGIRSDDCLQSNHQKSHWFKDSIGSWFTLVCSVDDEYDWSIVLRY